MRMQEQIYSVLVISASESFKTAWTPMLPESKFEPVHFVSSISSAKRTIAERPYDIVIINSPLPDDFGSRFAMEISGEKPSAVLLLVKADIYDETCSKVIEKGVYVLPKPTSKLVAEQVIDFLITTRERLRLYEKKTMSTEEKMQEIRTVNRAKWLLIENLKMNEADAHRYIEKQAMDRCVTRKIVADEIIKQYS